MIYFFFFQKLEGYLIDNNNEGAFQLDIRKNFNMSVFTNVYCIYNLYQCSHVHICVPRYLSLLRWLYPISKGKLSGVNS